MENSNPILEVRRLANRYDGQPLLQEISFSLRRGEILCLLGPSGAGKTSLLRLLAGLDREDGGTILFDGRDLRGVPPHRRKIGMMFQEYALFPHRSVWQNVAFGLEMQRCPAPDREKRVAAVLDLVGLAGFAERRVDELSGGERQRVALARSLAPAPHLLLLDEPLGSLDRALRDHLAVELRNILKGLQVTAVFVTHDQSEAFSLADRVAILQNGSLQQLDSPENLYRRPANCQVARFLGFRNLVAGRIDGEGRFCSPLGSLRLGSGNQPPGRELTLLLRPEGAALTGSGDQRPGLHLAGPVRVRQFQGGSYRLTLDHQGLTFTFDLPIDPAPPSEGQPVELLINPSALVLLA